LVGIGIGMNRYENGTIYRITDFGYKLYVGALAKL
jgi:hypothetical protein